MDTGPRASSVCVITASEYFATSKPFLSYFLCGVRQAAAALHPTLEPSKVAEVRWLDGKKLVSQGGTYIAACAPPPHQPTWTLRGLAVCWIVVYTPNGNMSECLFNSSPLQQSMFELLTLNYQCAEIFLLSKLLIIKKRNYGTNPRTVDGIQSADS